MKASEAAPLRVAVVDDNPLDRYLLRVILQSLGCEVLVDVGSGVEFLACMATGKRVDAVFMDIMMPLGNGMDAAAEMPGSPQLVFVTSYSEYAVRAFDMGAVDYILKPATVERLEMTLKRLSRTSGAPVRRLPRPQHSKPLERITVKNGHGEMQFLEKRKVSHFVVDDGQVTAFTGSSRFRTGWETLHQVERAFPEFLRIRRDCLLNPAAVQGFRPALWGRMVVRIGDGVELEVSRAMKQALRGRLSWILTKTV